MYIYIHIFYKVINSGCAKTYSRSLLISFVFLIVLFYKYLLYILN